MVPPDNIVGILMEINYQLVSNLSSKIEGHVVEISGILMREFFAGCHVLHFVTR